MAYILDLSISTAEAARAVALDQLQASIQQLKDQPEGLHKAVHDARKRLKKVRALLRLLRPFLGEDQYKALNVQYRDAGRRLAPLRNAQVRLETLDSVYKSYQSEIKLAVFKPIHQKLEKELAMLSALAKEEGLLAAVTQQLEEGEQAVSNWPLETVSLNNLLQGHLITYTRACKAMPSAFEANSADAYHEWRKRAKYCWYHYRLLKQLWEPVLKVKAREMHQLTSLLGDAHDLSGLINYLPEDTSGELLKWAADQERGKLRENTCAAGTRLFALQPGAHKQQLQAWVEAKGMERGS